MKEYLDATGLAELCSNIKTYFVSLLANYAPKANPTFTGTPTAPTPTAEDNSTQIATTAFVRNALSNSNVGEHTHTTENVTALTGYTIASSASAIAATDSLNTALGKLQKSIDGKQNSGSYANATHNHTGTEVTLTGYSKAPSVSSVSGADTVNTAIGKLEKALDEKQDSGSYLTVTDTAADSNKLGGIVATDYALKTYVDETVADLVDSAPTTLDTLSELAAALGDNPNFATTIATQIGEKADADSVYTKTEIDTELADKADADDVYTKTEIDTELADKADVNDVYTKTEVDEALVEKADADDVYTKTEVDTILEDYAPIDSPELIGTPTAPTPASGDDSTQIATTEFVQSALSNIVPIIISDDTTMPNSVNNDGVWFQLTGDTSIVNGESVGY